MFKGKLYKTSADVWSRGLDSDKERGRATGENRNENAAVDTGVSLKDKKRKEVIKRRWVACITDKIREARLRWYGHVMRREDENSTKIIMTAEVNRRHS